MSDRDRQTWDKIRREAGAKKRPYREVIVESKLEYPQDSIQATTAEVKQGQALKGTVCQELRSFQEREERPNRRKPIWRRAAENAQEIVKASKLRVMERVGLAGGDQLDLCKCEMSFRFGDYGLKTLRVIEEALNASWDSKGGLLTVKFEIKCERKQLEN